MGVWVCELEFAMWVSAEYKMNFMNSHRGKLRNITTEKNLNPVCSDGILLRSSSFHKMTSIALSYMYFVLNFSKSNNLEFGLVGIR